MPMCTCTPPVILVLVLLFVLYLPSTEVQALYLPAYVCPKIQEFTNQYKGRGLIATTFIPRGELLIQEKPIVSLTREEAWFESAEVASKLLLNQLTNKDKDKDKDKELSLDEQHSLADLHHYQSGDAGDPPTEDGSLLGRFRTNAHPMTDERSGLFPLISRINHDCRPNVHFRYDGELLLSEVYAVRDIAVNEELNMCYIDQLLVQRARQEYLSKQFGFTCRCAACMKTGDDLVKDDQARETLYSLELECLDLLGDGPEGPQLGSLVDARRFLEIVKIRLRRIDEMGLMNDPSIVFNILSGGCSAACSYLASCSDDDPYRGAIEGDQLYYLGKVEEFERTFLYLASSDGEEEEEEEGE